jgi:hypothetical protein
MFRSFSSVTSLRRATVRNNSRRRGRTRSFEALDQRQLTAADLAEAPSIAPLEQETAAYYSAVGTERAGHTSDPALEALILLELKVDDPIPLLDQIANGGAPSGLEAIACSNNLVPPTSAGPHVIDPNLNNPNVRSTAPGVGFMAHEIISIELDAAPHGVASVHVSSAMAGH